MVDVGDDLRLVCGRPRGDHAELVVEDHPGGLIQHRRRSARLRRVLREVRRVRLCERGDVAADQRNRLRSNHMVRREWSSRRERRQVGSGDEPTHDGIGVTLQDQWPAGCARNRPAKLSEVARRDLPKRRRLSFYRRSALVQPRLGGLEQLEVLLVRLARGRPECEEAVVQQDHSARLSVGLPGPDPTHLAREVEARHDVRNDDDRTAEDLSDDLLSVRQVRERGNHVGVAVLNRGKREKGVQQRLDGGRWRSPDRASRPRAPASSRHRSATRARVARGGVRARAVGSRLRRSWPSPSRFP